MRPHALTNQAKNAHVAEQLPFGLLSGLTLRQHLRAGESTRET